jgi:hypothetical protein
MLDRVEGHHLAYTKRAVLDKEATGWQEPSSVARDAGFDSLNTFPDEIKLEFSDGSQARVRARAERRNPVKEAVCPHRAYMSQQSGARAAISHPVASNAVTLTA